MVENARKLNKDKKFRISFKPLIETWDAYAQIFIILLYLQHYHLRPTTNFKLFNVAMLNIIVILLLDFLVFAAPVDRKLKLSEAEKWKLGWRMIISSMENDYDLGERQFDSLLTSRARIENKFILTGLEILKKRSREEKLNQVIRKLDRKTLEFLCSNSSFKMPAAFEYCKHSNYEVSDPELELELIRIFVNDQVARGGNMDNIISKFKLIKEEVIIRADAMSIDEHNRNKLKEIFARHGFPTRKMVGSEAMNGVFLIIQHSDADKIWQKSQLTNIKNAVKKGDMDAQSYAYLYDRIKINSGEKQLYGTQFAKVDAKNRVAELATTEDLGNLDKRRMEIGIMPIETYKAFMIKSFNE